MLEGFSALRAEMREGFADLRSEMKDIRARLDALGSAVQKHLRATQRKLTTSSQVSAIEKHLRLAREYRGGSCWMYGKNSYDARLDKLEALIEKGSLADVSADLKDFHRQLEAKGRQIAALLERVRESNAITMRAVERR